MAAKRSQARRRVGRPTSTATPSAEASERLSAKMDERKVTPKYLGEHLKHPVHDTTVRRWLNGAKGQPGPTKEQARELGTFFDEPTVVTWWVWEQDEVTVVDHPRDDADTYELLDYAAKYVPVLKPSANETIAVNLENPEESLGAVDDSGTTDQNEDDSLGRTRDTASLKARWSKWIPSVGIVAVILLVMLIGVTTMMRNWVLEPADTTPSTVSSPLSSDSAGGQSASLQSGPSFTGKVNALQAGLPAAKTISLWTQPSSNTGCDISACIPGTATSGIVRANQQVTVVCWTQGQEIRNGVPGASGFYKSDKWLRVDPSQDFGQRHAQSVYLSNVWFARDQLPDWLTPC
jgi:hypothetical protein